MVATFYIVITFLSGHTKHREFSLDRNDPPRLLKLRAKSLVLSFELSDPGSQGIGLWSTLSRERLCTLLVNHPPPFGNLRREESLAS